MRVGCHAVQRLPGELDVSGTGRTGEVTNGLPTRAVRDRVAVVGAEAVCRESSVPPLLRLARHFRFFHRNDCVFVDGE
jgi:hypothetical protein